MLEKSKTGTVPLLILDSGKVIEESLDIIFWALSKSKEYDKWYFKEKHKTKIFEIIKENDTLFKFHLDRYKYSSRFNPKKKEFHFLECQKLINRWNNLVTKNQNRKWLVGEEESIADWCLWPFVRQFKIACESQKMDNFLKPGIETWLEYFENHTNFEEVMHKYQLWNKSSQKIFFPLT